MSKNLCVTSYLGYKSTTGTLSPLQSSMSSYQVHAKTSTILLGHHSCKKGPTVQCKDKFLTKHDINGLLSACSCRRSFRQQILKNKTGITK
jgi:hypothetical protein